MRRFGYRCSESQAKGVVARRISSHRRKGSRKAPCFFGDADDSGPAHEERVGSGERKKVDEYCA